MVFHLVSLANYGMLSFPCNYFDAIMMYFIVFNNYPKICKLRIISILAVTLLLMQVKMCHLPTLPRHKDLASELGPIHARLSREGSFAKKHPVYRCNEVQVYCHTCMLTASARDSDGFTLTKSDVANFTLILACLLLLLVTCIMEKCFRLYN